MIDDEGEEGMIADDDHRASAAVQNADK